MSVPDSPSRFPRSAPVALASCLLLAACRSPGPLPPSDLPPVEFLGVAQAVEFRDGEMPLDEAGDLPATLTMEEVLRRALLSSPELQAALARVRAAEAEARQERLLPNPVLSVTLRAVEGGGNPGLDLGIAGDLHALMTRGDRADGADARLRAAVAEAAAVALDVAAEAAALALEVRALEERLPLLEGRREVLDRLHGAAEARFRSGEGRPLDVTVVEEEGASAELDVAEVRGDLVVARLTLARRLGRPGDGAAWTVRVEAARGPLPPLREWMAAAADRRPEMQAFAWERAALEAEARLAGLGPREGTEGGVEVEGTTDWEAGPSLTVPLPFFDDGSTRGAAILARLAEVRHRRVGAARSLVEEVRRAHAEHEAADAARRAAVERLLPLAEKRRAEADAIYRSGESDLVDVLLAENALQEARLRVLDFETRAASARVRLFRAAGGAPPGNRPPAAQDPDPATRPGDTHEAR